MRRTRGPMTFFSTVAPISELDFVRKGCEYCSDIGANTRIQMYSPKIDQHTPALYRLAKAVGKPMTKVADDLILFGFKCLRAIYEDLDERQILKIIQQEDEAEKD